MRLAIQEVVRRYREAKQRWGLPYGVHVSRGSEPASACLKRTLSCTPLQSFGGEHTRNPGEIVGDHKISPVGVFEQGADHGN